MGLLLPGSGVIYMNITILVIQVYWYISQVSGERLQDHWSSGIRFGTKLYRQIVGIPMGTNSAPLVADLFLYCYERDFKDCLNHDNQADVLEAFNSISGYLDDLLSIDYPYFEGMVNQIYPP